MGNSKMELCNMHHSRRRARIIATILLPAFLVGIAVLAVYLVFRPMKPQASVARATVFRMSANSGGNSSELEGPSYALAVSAQFTLLLHNPSDHSVLFYDGLLAYMTYRREVVALPPPCSYSGWCGKVAPMWRYRRVSALAAPCLSRYPQTWLVHWRATARRGACRSGSSSWVGSSIDRSGPIRTGWHDLYVCCDVIVGLRVDATLSDNEASDIPLLEYPQCSIDA